MENAADALGMAAAILIFIVAIASSFSLFGTAKETADSIIRMRDKQVYLEPAQLDTILYLSSDKLQEKNEEDELLSNVSGFTSKGDRIVNTSDVFSTIYRYSKEKYGVTIMNQNGEIIRRFDSNTEMLISQYNNIDKDAIDEEGNNKYEKYIQDLNNNTKTAYVGQVKFSDSTLQRIYKITGKSKLKCGAPWYGNEEEIQKRINADISKETYTSTDGQKYEGYGLAEELEGKKIIEVTNEIDQSKYIEDNGQQTNLLQEYKMPTLEIVYIVYE